MMNFLESQASALDAVLQSFLRATEESETQSLLGELISRYADPVCRRIVRARLSHGRGAQEADDVWADVRLRLLQRLRNLKTRPQERPIRDFLGYVAVVTYRAVDEHIRQRHPQRWRLKNQIRYLLTHRKGFSLWQPRHREWLCALAGSPGPAALPPGSLDGLVAQILEDSGRPVELDRLVGLIAELQGVQELAPLGGAADPPNPRQTRDVLDRLEQRLFLERLWTELGSLPQRQRIAVLLNLRDSMGASAVELFQVLGVASVRQIAAALAMGAEEFAELWNRLPLDDATIAAFLGVTRQQVINLRKAARERLRRWARRAC
ncbi:MAG: hypothetical protein L0191_01395 [Acidobacteria bacterium]|nr:hypothetical protein [Acidobacteriota bacterium]